jgi:hypothetical protein
MSHKQYIPPTGSHEARLTRREQKAKLAEETAKYEAEKKRVEEENAALQAAAAPPAASEPTEEDQAQIKKLIIYGSIGVGLIFVLMFVLFIMAD